jgi:uncharacterized membrane protein
MDIYSFDGYICRNWGYHWNEGGTSDDPCSETYLGKLSIILLHKYCSYFNYWTTVHPLGGLVRQPNAIAGFIPQSGTKNTATGSLKRRITKLKYIIALTALLNIFIL